VITERQTLPAGTRFGPYQIVALIGSGGMADVYRAHDTRLNRVVALKVLSAHVADTPQRRQRFEREARAISSLSHPHICVLYDVGEDHGQPFLVMEFVAGETLAQRLRRGPLPLQDALRLAILVADALDHAHRQGIVHRDLKPANVMLTSSGPKLVDFGVARLREAEPEASGVTEETESLTSDGMLLGTLPYMAPEQVEAKQADARSDIFAFGSLLYEILTAHRAFEAESKAGLIVSILEHEPPALGSSPHLKPVGSSGPLVTHLEHVVARCLAKQPDDRWQTAADLKRELRWIAERSWPTPVPASPWSARVVAATVIGALLLALVGLTVERRWLTHADPRVATSTGPMTVFELPMPAGQMFVSGPSAPQAAVSPDGQWVAFAAGTSTVAYQVWLWRARDGFIRPLPHTNEGEQPFWSPDSQSVGFFAHGRLKVTRLDDSAPLDLAAAPVPDGASWGSDGTIVFAPTQGLGLMRVPAKGGPAEVATRLNEARHEQRHSWPSFLPDGRRFLYFVKNTAEPQLTGVAIGRLGEVTDQPKLVMPNTPSRGVFARGSILFARELTLFARPFDLEHEVVTGEETAIVTGVAANDRNGRVAFSASDSTLIYRPGDKGGISPTRLEWRDRLGHVTETLADVALYGALALSPDGRHVAVQRANPSELRLFDHGPKSVSLASIGRGGSLVWSTTGDAIAYARDGGVAKKTLGSGGESTLFEGLPGADLTGWSPNGRTLFFSVADPVTGWHILEATVGGGPPRPYLSTSHMNGHAQFSPDGRWIVYVSEESGVKEVWVGTDPASSMPIKISDGGGYMPLWRADGRALYYLDAANWLVEVDVELGANFKAGKPHRLFQGVVNQGLADHYVNQYAVSRDGQRFLFKTLAQPDPPLKVMLNWPSGNVR
jgi:tRNA A-37 threonylcarbamoyl transferase component Bud32/Tol biopolymer transport system component